MQTGQAAPENGYEPLLINSEMPYFELGDGQMLTDGAGDTSFGETKPLWNWHGSKKNSKSEN